MQPGSQKYSYDRPKLAGQLRAILGIAGVPVGPQELARRTGIDAGNIQGIIWGNSKKPEGRSKYRPAQPHERYRLVTTICEAAGEGARILTERAQLLRVAEVEEYEDEFRQRISNDDSGVIYWREVFSNFYQADFKNTLGELSMGDYFVRTQGLAPETRRRWKIALSTLEGSVLTHAMTHARLAKNPKIGRERWGMLAGCLQSQDQLNPHVRLAWGSMMRLGAEVLIASRRAAVMPRDALVLLQQALSLQNEAIEMATGDPIQVAIIAEAFATAADLERFFPKQAESILDGRQSLAYFEQGNRVAAQLGRDAEAYRLCLYEMVIKSELRRIQWRREQGEVVPFTDADARKWDDGLLRIARTVKANQVGTIVGINAAVTRIQLCRLAGSEPPTEEMRRANRLVDRAGDNEQRARLKRVIGLRGLGP